jgi:hypothetical protein
VRLLRRVADHEIQTMMPLTDVMTTVLGLRRGVTRSRCPRRHFSRDILICRSARTHHVVTASCSSQSQQIAVGSVAETGAADDRLMAGDCVGSGFRSLSCCVIVA